MQTRQGGYVALLAVLVVGAVATAVSLILLMTGADSQRSSLVAQRSIQARGLVSTCAEEALQVIHDDTSYTGTGNVSLGQGSCTYTVTNGGGGSRSIAVSATVGGAVRSAALAITVNATSITVNSWADTVAAGVVGTPAFVQVVSSTPQSSPTSVAATFAAQTAGNTNVVAIGFDNATSNIVSVTDTAGNTYQQAAPLTRGSGMSHAIYYAKNIAGGTPTVTVTFDVATAFPDLRILEYSGLDTASPLDTQATNTGLNNPASSGSLTTTYAKSIIVATGIASNSFPGPGAGYTQRIITSPNGSIVEDQTVSSAGSYSATASASGNWIFQAVAFRASGQ